MYEEFKKHFAVDQARAHRASDAMALHSDDQMLIQLVAMCGGESYDHGLYRVVAAGAVEDWILRVEDAFPAFAGRLTCFGYDWLGRVFASDIARNEDGSPGVLMLEPGTGEALEIPANIASFHDRELVEHKEEALAASFHARWLASGGAIPSPNQCAGYRSPLFLGGKDSIENLEISDVDVYWSLAAQMIRKTRGLPPGTRLIVRKPARGQT